MASVASAFKSEKQARIAAIDNARDAILERTEKQSAMMMKGLLANPELTYKIQAFEKIIEILLNKGFKEDLEKLSKDKRTGKVAKSQIRRTIAEVEFKNLCQAA